MRLTNYFLPVLKESPNDAEIVSHQLMLRAGMISQSSSGIYSWLPLGLRVLKKIENIVRDEQDAAGVNEILMPTIQPADLWKESGRYEDYGKEMLRINDRQDREMLYGPTNEEQVTDIFRRSIKSYKELPQLLYHIQWKFRDELRPRFGVMRGREFLMKDAYSFDLDKQQSEISYNKFFVCYLKTFQRLELKAIPMTAETGPIGGDLSHEFIIISQTGESDIYFDSKLLEQENELQSINYSEDLSGLVNSYKSLYAVSDDKFNQDNFDNNVLKENQTRSKGIEVGHIFSFGTKYSETMKANVLNNDGKQTTVFMGSYGIGISRLVGAIIESSNDDKGIIWPKSVSPYDIGLINLKQKDNDITAISNGVYEKLLSAGFDVLYDDKNDNPGVKFSRMDLIGLPFQVIVGNKSKNDSILEVKNRKTGDISEVSIENITSFFKNN
ncbi:MAG: proline--tRNA ligase [Candidatus Pelagibacterales bacterium]|jgi:prolyl-tRNA synthetase|tara:strand:- start:495 stop:1817 length:1323 start_codon:yes stop_codon:yes gene_type:complete